MDTPRERVLKTLRHEHPGRFPKEMGFTPAAFQKFKSHTGSEDPASYFGMEVRHIGAARTSEVADFSGYYADEDLPEGTTIDDYGTARVPAGFYHFWGLRFPAKCFSSLAQYEGYPWPTFAAPADAENTVQACHDAGLAVGGFAGHIWETAWQVRGMNELMMDFLEREDMAAYLLDRIADQVAGVAQGLARAGVDVLQLGDDVGMQDRLMMSPGMWREWLFPRLKRAIDAARAVNPGLHVWYHTDGDVRSIIPGLMEAGVDVLNPVQPECMDPAELRAEYGDSLAFWGCVGTQTTLPFGSPEDVKRTVHHLIETVGASGGLFIAPTHVVEPDVPWPNIAAFFEAIEEASA
jgi:uroporphyrinogen decarboxylase